MTLMSAGEKLRISEDNMLVCNTASLPAHFRERKPSIALSISLSVTLAIFVERSGISTLFKKHSACSYLPFVMSSFNVLSCPLILCLSFALLYIQREFPEDFFLVHLSVQAAFSLCSRDILTSI